MCILGEDYCERGHKCHVNATCLNLQTRYACQCFEGFTGDGTICHGEYFNDGVN